MLDASCGAGAQAIPLAELGFEVVAADPSAGMLRKAYEIAKSRGCRRRGEQGQESQEHQEFPHTPSLPRRERADVSPEAGPSGPPPG